MIYYLKILIKLVTCSENNVLIINDYSVKKSFFESFYLPNSCFKREGSQILETYKYKESPLSNR
jgi:hypothetical protein